MDFGYHLLSSSSESTLHKLDMINTAHCEYSPIWMKSTPINTLKILSRINYRLSTIVSNSDQKINYSSKIHDNQFVQLNYTHFSHQEYQRNRHSGYVSKENYLLLLRITSKNSLSDNGDALWTLRGRLAVLSIKHFPNLPGSPSNTDLLSLDERGPYDSRMFKPFRTRFWAVCSKSTCIIIQSHSLNFLHCS